MRCDREDERLDGVLRYALGEMTAAERADFERHLELCAACRQDVDEQQHLQDQLLMATAPLQPPARVAERLFARLEAPAPSLGLTGGPWRGRMAWVAALAVLVLGNGLLGWQVVHLQGRLGALEAQRARQEAMVAAALMATQQVPGAKTVRLAGTAMAPAAGGVLVMLPGQGQQTAFLTVAGLPRPRGQEVYQLWLIHDGQRINGGTFTVDDKGQARMSVALGPNMRFEAVGITLEPDSLGTQPRGKKVLGGTV